MASNDEDYRAARKDFEGRMMTILDLQDKRIRDLELKVAVIDTRLYIFTAIAVGLAETAKHFLFK